MDDRGRLTFKDDSEDLKEAKELWEGFLAMETEDKEKYFRALEIQFSLNSIANEKQDFVSDEMVEVFTDEKMSQAKIPSRKKKLK